MLEQIILSERLAPVISSEVGQVDGQAGSLVGASVLKTLVYLSTHHYAVAENLLHSPLAPRKIHRLTNKQFTWATLRAKVEAWTDCENFVVGKGCRVEVSIWIVKKKRILGNNFLLRVGFVQQEDVCRGERPGTWQWTSGGWWRGRYCCLELSSLPGAPPGKY